MDISIVITSYNYAHYLEECVCSCLDQKNTSLKYEVLIIDDGSEDDTSNILTKFKDSKLRIFRIKNSGIEVASNHGFANSRGNFVVRVDADDKLDSNYLNHMSKWIKEPYGFFYSDYQLINGDGFLNQSVKLPDFNDNEIFCRGDFLATGTLFRTDIITKYGGYLTEIKNSGLENYELILRLIMDGIVGFHIPHSLFYYRRHSLNISNKKRDQIIKNGNKIFKKYGLGVFSTNCNHPYGLVLP